MRKTFMLVAVLAFTLGTVGGASAADHGHPWDEHGHVLLLDVEWENDEPTSYGKCVDIANGQKLDRVHHTTVRRGRAGEPLQQAGHLVAPTAGLTPWANCDDLVNYFGPPR